MERSLGAQRPQEQREAHRREPKLRVAPDGIEGERSRDRTPNERSQSSRLHFWRASTEVDGLLNWAAHLVGGGKSKRILRISV